MGGVGFSDQTALLGCMDQEEMQKVVEKNFSFGGDYCNVRYQIYVSEKTCGNSNTLIINSLSQKSPIRLQMVWKTKHIRIVSDYHNCGQI